MKEMDLTGVWELKPVERFDGEYDRAGTWLSQELPAHWQDLPELEYYTGKVVYRKRFKFKPEAGKRFWLKLCGVFYWSTAYLNGCRLGANEGYFFPRTYEITGLLEKENELLVEVDCPAEADKANKRMLTGVFHHWDCLDPLANPGGIWLPVEIHSTGKTRIVEARFATLYFTPEYARLEGRVTLESAESEKLRVKISLLPRNFEGEPFSTEREVMKPEGSFTYVYSLDLRSYALWWTWDRGSPNLYTLRVEVIEAETGNVSEVFEEAFGVRTIEFRKYLCYLNGQKLYLRGNNYPPGEARLARMNRERIEKDLELARQANLNLLRVHAHVDHPELYRVADEKGILLWQDFPLQWYYSKEIEPQALRQAEKMIQLLGNHPSLALWCLHNEPIRQFDLHQRIGPLAVLRWLFSIFIWNWDRDVLDKKLEARVRSLDPSRYVHRSSGERGLFRQDPGDGHWYFGWYFGPLSWLNYLVRKKPERLQMVTEFGSQSFPNYPNSLKFMEDKFPRLDYRHLAARHHLQPGLLKYWVNPKHSATLADYIQATQDYQSELNRYYIDRLRSLKYRPNGGCVAFLLLDSNPAIQWSVIDYWREPKSSYFALQKAMSPVYAFLLLDRRRYASGKTLPVTVFAVNDTNREVEARLELTVTNPVGHRALEDSTMVTLPADCETRAVMNPELLLQWEGEYRVEVRLLFGEHQLENHYRFRAG